MKPMLRAHDATLTEERRLRREKFGVTVSLRLRDGTVKERVEVEWDGSIRAEWYEEEGIRSETYGPPRFASGDIESWGYYERVRQPSWLHPFKKVKVWKVRVWADGRLGMSVTQ